MRRPLRTFTAIALAAALLAPPAAASAAEPTPADTARIVAGMSSEALADDPARHEIAKSFVAELDALWTRYEAGIATKIRAWAKAELAQPAGGTVFYPFAGPDLPTVQLLYPDADRYVLVALQKGGRLPALHKWNLKTFRWYLKVYRRGWRSFSRRGFFHTDHMKRDMDEASVLEGITPILMGFAARLGYTVEAVDPIRIAAGGVDVELHPGDRGAAETWDSVRLTLKRDRDGRKVLVDYLFLDLSDGYLGSAADARAWIEAIAHNPVVTKAASHLMQKPFFSIITKAILDHAPSVWQDETGIDYGDLSEAFDVRLYGDFTRANKLWTEGVQRSLAKAYRTRRDVRPLPFKVGYRKQSGSCVQVAVRKP
ncbi:MAG: hypothetical protein CSA66_01710 [Proteobacteria bacterium]|nr:MAG: hypothetical protein CSA66_01710 [Pseudomonadota bacterium]